MPNARPRPVCSRLPRTSIGAGALALAAVATCLTASTVASAQVIADHPRIYLTKKSLEAVRLSAPTDPAYTEMPKYMKRRVDNHADALVMAKGNGGYLLMMTAGLVALVSKDKTYIDEAKSYLDAIVGVPPNAKTDVLGTRNRLYAMAIGYDWLYAELDAAARKKAVDAIYAYVTSLQDLLDDEQFVSGPSRWANVTALAGTIAVHGDDTRLDTVFAATLKRWRDGYNPALDSIGVGGGHQMAWYYGVAYSGFEAYFMWKTAAEKDESWAAQYLKDVAYFPIYGTNGSYRVPVVEDSGADKIEVGTLQHLAVSSGIYQNPHAEAFEQELEAIVQGPAPQPMGTPRKVIAEPTAFVIRVITRAGAPKPQPIASLPLSRFFSGSGFLVARDSWDRAAATTLVFKASPFYSSGHHQRDEGSLVVDFKGPLLVDAGSYDGGDGTVAERDHYRNFYTRTVAHNSLLVHSPTEKSVVPNYDLDGGQTVRLTEARNLADTKGAFALKGIVGQSDAGACVWSRADLADTYDKGKLTSYTRDVLEIRRPDKAPHPAIYVLDRTVLPAALPSSVLWQFGEAATITGQRIAATNAGGGHVRLDVVRPTKAKLVAISGDDKFKVAGKARLPAPADVKWPYWGRVEVSPETDQAGSTWSTLIRVGESAAELGSETPIDLGATDWVGTRLGGTLYAVGTKATKALTLPAGAALVDGCIAGLESNAIITVTVGTNQAVKLQANADGVAVYDPSSVVPGQGGSGGASGNPGTSGAGGAVSSGGSAGNGNAGSGNASAGGNAGAGNTSAGGFAGNGSAGASNGSAGNGNAGATAGKSGSAGQPANAGASGSGNTAGGTAATAAAPSTDESGCGCRVLPRSGFAGEGALALSAALGLAIARRKRRTEAGRS